MTTKYQIDAIANELCSKARMIPFDSTVGTIRFGNAYFVEGCSRDGFVVATSRGDEVLTVTKCKNGHAYFHVADDDDRKYWPIADLLNRAELQYDEIAAEVR